MKKHIRGSFTFIITLVLLLGTLTACNKAEDKDVDNTDNNSVTVTMTPTAEPETAAEFTDLNQAAIVGAMGLGWNLGNQLEAVNDNGIVAETNWGNPAITEELIKAVKAAGFQSVRIPVSYFKMIGEGPDYTIDSKWLDRIQEVVDYCVNNDLYAVINVHGDGFQSIDGGWLYCDGADQDTIKAKFKALWQQVATRFKDYDEHLIFESMNEISDMSYAQPKKEMYDNINAYNQLFLDTVRQSGGNNNMRWVLIPGWNTDIGYTAGDYGFIIPTENYLSEQIPEGENRVMVSVHYYAPWDFCGGESGEITQWGESAKDTAKTSAHSGQSFMAAQFKSLSDKFTSKGYPVVIGEFGAIDKSKYDPDSNFYREYFDRKLCENCYKYGCVPMYWDNGYNTEFGFGLFDRASATVTQQGIIDAMLNIYHPVTETGTSTGITLDQTSMAMVIGDPAVTLKAVLTPADSTDTIRWSSSDETVATVSDSGAVKAQLPGNATITASANGKEAQCSVVVTETLDVRVMLYAIETSAWSVIQSEDSATITKDGGTFTLTLKGSKDVLANIGSLYIKDIQVQSAITKSSLYQSAQIKVNSVKFNGVDCTVKADAAEEAINKDSKAFDYCLLNQWVEDSEKIAEVAKGDTGSYGFTNAEYSDTNTVEITFTVTDVVMP